MLREAVGKYLVLWLTGTEYVPVKIRRKNAAPQILAESEKTTANTPEWITGAGMLAVRIDVAEMLERQR